MLTGAGKARTLSNLSGPVRQSGHGGTDRDMAQCGPLLSGKILWGKNNRLA